MPPQEIIQTALVTLRRLNPDDSQALFDLADDAEVMRYMDWPHPQHVQEVSDHVQQVHEKWDKGLAFQWVVIDNMSQAVAGTISCRPSKHAADFGYFLGRQWWGRGLGSEASRLVIAWLAEQPGIHRIWATADADNLRSRRVLERTGLVLEGVLKRSTVRPNIGGIPRDTALYAWARSE